MKKFIIRTMLIFTFSSVPIGAAGCFSEGAGKDEASGSPFASFSEEAYEVLQPASTPNAILNHTGDEGYTPVPLLYSQGKWKLAKYEPEAGCYSGAYIMSSGMFLGDIKSFEKHTGINHTFYSYNMRLGGNYPQAFILSCIANKKTPNITIYPPLNNENGIYDWELLEKTAKAFSLFNIPMFIQFYPYSKYDSYGEPREYAAFFRMAEKLFEQYAPSAALVWNVFHEDVYSCNEYYPGDEAVDWVGISVYASISKNNNGEYSYNDIMKDIDYFYMGYQKTKPVMLSELAISHYTIKNNIYNNNMAIALLEEVFNSVKYMYPRIKAFNYMDVNMLNKNGTDNFLITDEEAMKNAYNGLVSSNHFLSVIEPGGSLSKSIYKSEFLAYQNESRVLIPESALLYNFNFKLESFDAISSDKVYIGSERYYPARSLEKTLPVYMEFGVNNNSLVLYK